MDVARNYVQNFLSGSRFHDWSQLWQRSVQRNPQAEDSILVYIESWLITMQELALWVNPKSTVTAIALIHLLYFYLSYSSTTSVSLLAWSAIVGFVYTTWVNRIWPEISVKESTDDVSVAKPATEVYSAAELKSIVENCRNKIWTAASRLLSLRRESPANFCFLSCGIFCLLAFVGSSITALGLFYYISVGTLTIPGALRYAAQKHPSVQEYFNSFKATSSESSSSAVDASTSNLYNSFQTRIGSLLSELYSTSRAPEEDDKDELQEFLPHPDNDVLENVASPRDQSHVSEEESLEYSSLTAGLGQTMPDIDEDETDHPNVVRASAGAAVSESEDDFLPNVDRQLLIDEIDREDDDTNSLSDSSSGKVCLRHGDEADDREEFEFISQDELVEALRK